MSNPGEAPVELTNEKIKKLHNHIMGTFQNHDEHGEVDLERCQNNVAYNIGNIYSNYNGLLLQERLKLADIKADLSIIREKAYHDIKMTKVAYDLDATGLKLKVEGNQTVAYKQREYEKQEYYVKYLEGLMRQISAYSAGVKTILYREEIKFRYNQ
jgi:hypothetical protein